MREKIWDVLRDWAHPTELEPKLNGHVTWGQLGMDSLDMIELHAILGEEFGSRKYHVNEDYTVGHTVDSIASSLNT